MIITEPCIKGVDDTDLYKLSCQRAYLARFPGVISVFQFQDRRPHGLYNQRFLDALKEQIAYIGTLRTETETIAFLGEKAPWLGPTYLEWLRNWHPNPDLVNAKVKDGLLSVRIEGPIEEASPWEIYLMPTISELNFKLIQTEWTRDGQGQQFLKKLLGLNQVLWSEFGTRRRRDWQTQEQIVCLAAGTKGFVGTSNVRLARLYNVRPMGTYPHEWVQTVSAMESLRYANRYAMRIWQEVFGARLGIALPDTFGTKSFLRDFDHTLARLFDGVRHDSGDPMEFAEKIIAHYLGLQIDPLTKTIIFSDNLNPQKCVELATALQGRIRTAFGIGTNLTNDYPGSPALNMVIKLIMCNWINVVKLSDSPTKAIGDADALAVARYEHLNIPLRESLGIGA